MVSEPGVSVSQVQNAGGKSFLSCEAERTSVPVSFAGLVPLPNLAIQECFALSGEE